MPTSHAPHRQWKWLLVGPGVFLIASFTAASPTARETPLNPTDHDYLYRQHVWFQAQEPDVQQRYRKLHAAYEALPADDQNHLARVLQNYQAWLARLPEADRQQVYEAPTAAERLVVVRRLRETEWVATLPAPMRQEYAAASEAERSQKVVAWRAEEAERRDEWAVAKQNWPDFLPGKTPNVLQNDNLVQVEKFVKNLKPALSDEERRRLDLERAAVEDQVYYPYALDVARLADAHLLCPGRVGPINFATLPLKVQEYLERQTHYFKKKNGSLVPLGEDIKEFRRAAGRWPDFAIELTRYCQKHGLKGLPPLGDCTETDMPPEVQTAMTELRKRRSAEVKTELDKLAGQWPEYPLKVVELCRKNSVPISGWTLPGPSAFWDKLKAGRAKVK